MKPPICVRLVFARRRPVTVRRFHSLELACRYAIRMARFGLAVNISKEG